MERLNPLTGDEPFYVMTAISLIEDQDIEESNNYRTVEGNPGAVRFADELYPDQASSEEWKGWPAYPQAVAPHQAHADRPGLYSKHGVGLPALIAVPWAVGERLGVELSLIIIAGLVAVQMLWLAQRAGAPAWASAVLAIGLATCMPIGPYGLLIFPEVPAALLIAYSVRRLAEPQNATWQWILIGVAVGYLPWLHQRFIPISLVLTLVLLLRISRDMPRKRALTSLIPVAIGGFGLLAFNYWLYGQPIQSTADHAGFSWFSGTVNGLFGLLLDAQWGLVIAAPVMILAIAALPTWIRRDPDAALIAISACLPYLLLVGAYRVWWGEWGPPARYLVPVAPFAAATLGSWIAGRQRGRLLITAVAWIPGALLTAAGYVHPQRFYHQPDGFNNLVASFERWIPFSVDRFLVSFQPYALDPVDRRIWSAVILMIVLAVCLCLVHFSDRRGSPTTGAR